MNAKYKKTILYLFVSIAFILSSVAISSGEEYEALKGVGSIKAVFDMRVSNPKAAAVHLDLIHKTFTDPKLTINSNKPEIVIIFIGPSVKLVSKDRNGFTMEEQKQLDVIEGIISNMLKDGFKLEICMAAVHLLGVDANYLFAPQ